MKIVLKDLSSTSARRGAGFTLIELLIVITIVGVLATVLLVNFIGVRQRARDAQRKADLRQIQAAVELYKADQGVYPSTASMYKDSDGVTSNCPNSLASLTGGTPPAITYMQKFPCDPLPLNTAPVPYNLGNYYYSYSNSTKTYYLVACIENLNDKDPNMNPGAWVAICGSASISNRKGYNLTNP